MTILDKIVAQKAIEVAEAKAKISIEDLVKEPLFSRTTISLSIRLKADGSSGIIAEHKRKSPSKGVINDRLTVEFVTNGYATAGASGLSVLTDTDFFGGAKEDILKARNANPDTPILRKDFMIDAYQLYEAKAWGADVILLIAACLSPAQIEELSQKAHELGLEVLLEIHDEEELERSPLANVDIIGVNNRNLKNFAENNVNASLGLADKIPARIVKISESCISQPETINQLKSVGYKGFLIGETFMKDENPGAKLAEFIAKI
ncbi:indole-3-glycerol phosphate synthase TrpC [Emticicia sp. C21]|uniref:indole-3-glycerol phosphate synthase TrpC n=1 Tax=Emticicia sp. C21 TaxID=2302915 RepID=UPI000E353B26|nr:indole-3-glycerol phosphate synthase TrpC [Emticicia sp. C21]RFS15397.1 indole-3-glycerol phosphate synthase TrpC [Emticicia sp. C21]